MATFTVQHTASMSIEQALGLVSGAYERFGKSNGPGRGYNALCERYGIEGKVKSLEITWKPSSGWHVHLHVLLFLNAALAEGTLAKLEGDCAGRWAGAVEAEGGMAGDRSVVLSLLLNEGGTEGDGGYVVKDVLGRGDEKEGRTPWNLLEDYVTGGDGQARLLWKQYAAAISGKQRLSWSPEMRALGLMDDYEPEEGRLVRRVPRGKWAKAVRPEADARAALLVKTRKRG